MESTPEQLMDLSYKNRHKFPYFYEELNKYLTNRDTNKIMFVSIRSEAEKYDALKNKINSCKIMKCNPNINSIYAYLTIEDIILMSNEKEVSSINRQSEAILKLQDKSRHQRQY